MVASAGQHHVGDRVMALYADGQAYAATIAGLRSGGYTVDWDDGDDRHRERSEAQVFVLGGGAAAAAAEGDSAQPAPSRRVAAAPPPLAETVEESLNRKRQLERAALAREQAPPRKKPAPPASLRNVGANGLNPAVNPATGRMDIVAPRPGEDLAIVGREEQLERMLKFCKKCITAEKACTMYISGAPGVGKTLTMQIMHKMLKGWMQSSRKTARILNINAMQLSDPEHIFHIAYELLFPRGGDPGPRGKLRKKLEEQLKHSWPHEGQMTFLFIDEIDNLLTSSDTSVLYKLFEWASPGRTDGRSALILVAIANAME